MLIFDPAGGSTVGFSFDSSDPPLVIEAPDGSPSGLTWLTLARRSQWLRGHALNGDVLWDRPIPWEGWALHRLGRVALVTAADGRALSCDGAGSFLVQGAPTGDSNDAFGSEPGGEPIRITRRGVHLICAALDGQVRWRAVVDQTLGPVAAGVPGTVAFLGKSLAWFGNEPSPGGE